MTSSEPRFFARVPIQVWLAALLAAVIHLAPFWAAARNTPPDWTFTWNLSDSGDVMQYRGWFRHTQEAGWIGDNQFTGEPNRPHLPLFLYWLTGKIAGGRWLPEQVYAYVGAIFAFLLALLLYLTVRYFLPNTHAVWWVYFAILLGGGLGAHQKLIGRFGFIKTHPLLKRFFYDPFLSLETGGLVIEDYRGTYVFMSFSDTHFLVLWTVAAAAMVSYYFALRKFSWPRAIATALLCAAATVLHIYQGVTLLAAIAFVTLFCWRKGIEKRAAATCFAVCSVVLLAAIAWFGSLQKNSGIPLYPWREHPLDLTLVLMAFPVAWLVIFTGLYRYWKDAGLNECFLIGWAAGCTAITLSGPLYPYPVRGLVTMTIPLYLIAGGIYFSRRATLGVPAALTAILLLAATPGWKLARTAQLVDFRKDAPYTFLSADHREIQEILRGRAAPSDLLLADETELRWLAPAFPGRHYCAHFFLTVDYGRKQAEVARFWTGHPAAQAGFLRSQGIRFVFAARGRDLAAVPGLSVVKTGAHGTLFEFQPAGVSARLGARTRRLL